ncbi:MAG TPA: FG-GAP-like repeat-containing protein [Acidobacteriaceae bacterium]|jgi:hypothetical protein|nr:FG-GAP-like repeat-containing protein [Acidobacteriaceae bacterium]
MLRFRCACVLSVCLVLCCAAAFAQNPVTFTAHTSTAGLSPQDVYAVDINNDGIPDLIEDATSGGNNTVSIAIANGDGTFQAPKQLYVLPMTYTNRAPMAYGDFNGDGKVDLVFAMNYTNQLVVFLGNGDGTFQAPKIETVAFPSSEKFIGVQLLAADFNHDGKLDLAAFASANAGGLYVLPGDGTGSFGAPRSILSPTVTGNLAVGDFDGDGNADIAVAEGIANGANALHVLYGNGSFGFTDSTVYTTSSSYFYFASGDINSDGRTDLFGFPSGNKLMVWTSQPDRQWTTFSMDTSANLEQSTNLTAPPFMVADFNGDGNMDLGALAVLSGSGGTFQDVFDFFLANGSGGYEEQSVPTSDIGNLVAGDFNRDLRPDVATIDGHLAYPGTGAQMTVGLNETENGKWSPCAYPAKGQGIALCSPGSTSGTSVSFTASANSFGMLRKMELWIDGKKIAEQHHTWANRAWFNLTTTLSAGSHKVTLFAADIDNRLQKFTSTVQVGGSSCSAPASAGVNLCQPASGATVSSPVQVMASATVTGKLASMQLWVDGVKKYSETSSATLQTSISLSAGSHRFAVLAVNTSGQKWEQAVNATVK